MEHNLLTRYREYLRRRDELLRLRVNLEMNPTPYRVGREQVLSEALTKVHQSVMAAIYERTVLHAQRYKLEGLVKRFREAKRERNSLNTYVARFGKRQIGEKSLARIKRLTSEIDEKEQELMAEAIKQIDRIIDLESRDE